MLLSALGFRALTPALLASAALIGVAGSASAAVMPDPIIYGDYLYTGRAYIDTPRENEKTHAEILGLLYGGVFTPAGDHGLDYTNGQLYIQRVPDAVAPSQTPGLTSALFGTDQIWLSPVDGIEAHYRFAGYRQSFGYIPLGGPQESLAPAQAGPPGDFEELLQVGWQTWGDNYAPIGETADMPDLGGIPFLWARGWDNGVFTSDPSLNRDGADHLITYLVLPIEDQQIGIAQALPVSYLLFWEDQTESDNVHWYDQGDWDFNDLVVEIRGGYVHTPEPSALALAAIAATGLLRRRRCS